MTPGPSGEGAPSPQPVDVTGRPGDPATGDAMPGNYTDFVYGGRNLDGSPASDPDNTVPGPMGPDADPASLDAAAAAGGDVDPAAATAGSGDVATDTSDASGNRRGARALNLGSRVVGATVSGVSRGVQGARTGATTAVNWTGWGTGARGARSAATTGARGVRSAATGVGHGVAGAARLTAGGAERVRGFGIKGGEKFRDDAGNIDSEAWLDDARDRLAKISARSRHKIGFKKREAMARENYENAFNRYVGDLIVLDMDRGTTLSDSEIQAKASQGVIEDRLIRTKKEAEYERMSPRGKFLEWYSSKRLLTKAGIGIVAGAAITTLGAVGGIGAGGVAAAMAGKRYVGARANRKGVAVRNAERAASERSDREHRTQEALENRMSPVDVTGLDAEAATRARVEAIGNIMTRGIEKVSQLDRKKARKTAVIGIASVAAGLGIGHVLSNMGDVSDFKERVYEIKRDLFDNAGDTGAGQFVNEHTGNFVEEQAASPTTSIASAREAAPNPSIPDASEAADVPEWAQEAGQADDWSALHEAGVSRQGIEDILETEESRAAFGRAMENPTAFRSYIEWAEDFKEANPGMTDRDISEAFEDYFEPAQEALEGMDLDTDAFTVEAGHGITQEIADQYPGLTPDKYYEIYQNLHGQFGDNIIEGVSTNTLPNGDIGISAGTGHWAPGVREAIENMLAEEADEQLAA